MSNPVTPIEDVLKKMVAVTMAPVSRLSSERHKATACSLLMLHFSWNNHTVFQTPKGMPKLDNTSLPPPQLSPHATPPAPSLHPTPLCSPANQPTRHPLLPCTHPLVSCPYLGRDVLSSELWLGEGAREGVELTQGRQEEKQRALAALS